MPPQAVQAIAGAAAYAGTAAKAAGITAKANLTGSAATKAVAGAMAKLPGGGVGAAVGNLASGALGVGPYAAPMSALAAMSSGGSSSPAQPVGTSTEATPYQSRPQPMPGMMIGQDGSQRMKRFNDYFKEAMQR